MIRHKIGIIASFILAVISLWLIIFMHDLYQDNRCDPILAFMVFLNSTICLAELLILSLGNDVNMNRKKVILKYKQFRSFYALNPNRYAINDFYVEVDRGIVILFKNIHDYIKYWIFIWKLKHTEQLIKPEHTKEYLDLVKEDIKNIETESRKEINTAIGQFSNILGITKDYSEREV